MAAYRGPDCPSCGVRACGVRPGKKTPPGCFPMPAEVEALAAAERRYQEDGRLTSTHCPPTCYKKIRGAKSCRGTSLTGMSAATLA